MKKKPDKEETQKAFKEMIIFRQRKIKTKSMFILLHFNSKCLLFKRNYKYKLYKLYLAININAVQA